MSAADIGSPAPEHGRNEETDLGYDQLILSHDHELIFIHVGKTGGTSIEETLCPLIGIEFEDTYQNDDVIPGQDCKHISAMELKKILGRGTWDRYFKFSFVRNPYDRLLSDWSMQKQVDESVSWRNEEWQRYDGFGNFLDALVRGEKTITQDYQSCMLTDMNGRILVDFVGRFEVLQADFHKVCERIGFPRTKLSRQATTKHRPFYDYYDNRQRRQAVYQSCKEDFRLFGYSSALPHSDP